MCGIAALYRTSGHVEVAPVEHALVALRHRGPDGHGLWRDPEGMVVLGHTLLATIARSDVGQPIGDAFGNQVVVNGEFYGFEEIRHSLSDIRHAFCTASDSEIALPLYRKYGLGMFAHLRGEFSFLLWDASARRLIAARDRFGIKPLYYATHDGAFYFASEVKALFAMGIPRAWDEDALALYQAAHLPVGRTLFAGVHSVPPGHFIELSDGSAITHRYWAWPSPHRTAPADPVGQVREALYDAVRVRTRAQGSIGVYLSGGVDSTAVAGILRQCESQGEITALTVAFPGSDEDESDVAAASARHLGGVRLVRVEAGAVELAEVFETAVLAAEAPAVNSHGAAKYLLSRQARDLDLRVVLTGEGADELFWGYPHLAEMWVRDVPPWLDDEGGFAAVWQRLYRPDVAAGIQARRPSAEVVASVEAREDGPTERVARTAWLWSRTVLPSYLFRNLGDGVEMGNGVEGRLPFLDHRLAELVVGLEASWKRRDGIEKYVLREAVRPFVPPAIHRRKKQPFFGPAATGALRMLLVELCEETAATLPFLDPRRVPTLVAQLRTAPPVWDAFLFELASLCALHRGLDCSSG